MNYNKFRKCAAVSAICAAGLLAAVSGGCSDAKHPSGEAQADAVLLQVGDSVLTVDAVVAKIPTGLSMEDSLSMFNAITEDWLTERLLCDIATDNLPHPELIEERVRDYRNRLIAMEYRRLMNEKHTADNSGRIMPEDSVKAYYEAHVQDFTLSTPLIRGLYIKLPASDSHLSEIRKWMSTANPQSIDKLEKHGLKNAMQYDHFTNRWIDWQTVAGQIPYRFGNADAFLSKGKIFETEHNGSVYMLHVTDVLHSGARMPYEFAAIQIRDMMADSDREAYDRRLLKELYDKARKENLLKDNRPGTANRILNSER